MAGAIMTGVFIMTYGGEWLSRWQSTQNGEEQNLLGNSSEFSFSQEAGVNSLFIQGNVKQATAQNILIDEKGKDRMVLLGSATEIIKEECEKADPKKQMFIKGTTDGSFATQNCKFIRTNLTDISVGDKVLIALKPKVNGVTEDVAERVTVLSPQIIPSQN